MSAELITVILCVLLTATATLYLLGSILSIKLLRATFKVEELAKSYGLDYNIRNKKIMYVMCIVFSWLAYTALQNLKQEDTDKKDDKDGS